jgi:DNA-binding Lrp family transcriptional regulator
MMVVDYFNNSRRAPTEILDTASFTFRGTERPNKSLNAPHRARWKGLSRILAFVDIFVESPEMDEVVASLYKLKNLEELYEVTGEFDIVALVSAADIEEFRDVLKNKIMKIKGVKSTVTSIVLHTHKGPKSNNNSQAAR